jgi:hypothetical protein
VEFDSTKTKYADLVNLFFRMHNPTTLNKQGNDKGACGLLHICDNVVNAFGDVTKVHNTAALSSPLPPSKAA